ncbi:synaptotagmin-2 [Microcaecilia unicolor]|uniref:Synaptotagmin-2-like n=1 Tax=Microcaecilia unicolor TaxID=1415580 RepID=A0A6P7XXE5_9AMPH|nr:synaptotagmin-2-like [Microcaecilia unicolor]
MHGVLFLSQFQLPFSSALKYGLLTLALCLFVTAVIIFACHLYQYCKYVSYVNTNAEKKYLTDEYGSMERDKSILENNLSPSLLEISKKKNHNMKKLQVEMEKLERCLTPPTGSSESLESLSPEEEETLGSSKGRLRFSLLYNENQLQLKVIEGMDLPRHSTDPFVRIKLFSRYQSEEPVLQCVINEWETRLGKKRRNPTFGDEFSCALMEKQLEKVNIKLEVRKFDKYSRNTVLGEVRATLNNLKTSELLEFCEEIQQITKDLVGEILVSLKYLPTAQRIEVGLLKVRSGSLSSAMNTDTYARVDVFSSQRRQKHQKSSPQPKAQVIVFNEAFHFHLPDVASADCVVLISMYEIQASGRKLIGQASLGKHRASNVDEHWNLMLQSLRQPVAKWHPLLI